MITLTSSDGVQFDVRKVVAKESQIIRDMIQDDCVITNIPIANVNQKILSLVLEYCQMHVDKVEMEANASKPQTTEGEGSSSNIKKDLKDWDKEFINVDLDTLYDLILAANYLNISGLLNLTTQAVADIIKGKTVEEIRATFKIKNDFTPEEEEVIRKEHPWAFE